jgi:steroid delta-isomerase-like uncharacterized protein
MNTTSDMGAPLRRFFEELWNERRLELIDELLAPDHVWHTPAHPAPVVGRDGFRAYAQRILSGFPDVHLAIEALLVDGDQAVARVSMRGTHTGEYMGIPPTGRTIETTQIVVARLRDGRLQTTWQEVDALRILTQLGAVPPVGLGPLGFVGWAATTVGRFALLTVRARRRARREGGAEALAALAG